MGRRGAPKKGEQMSALAKLHNKKKHPSRNGGSAAAAKGQGSQRPKGLLLEQPQQSKDLFSVMEMESIDEFLVHAELTNREFESHRGPMAQAGDEVSILVVDPSRPVKQHTSAAGVKSQKSHAFEYHALPLPERPPWAPTDSQEELERREVDSFLDWRRRLAATEEAVWAAQESSLTEAHRYQDVKVTPYEKNLEVWRQLWRVVERADVLIQVVDARQPFFYYSQHLHDYARTHYRHPTRPSSQHVERLMIINKADYLTRDQRLAWGKALRQKGFRFVWFSAKEEQQALDERARARRDGLQADGGGEESTPQQQSDGGAPQQRDRLSDMASRDELMALLEKLSSDVHANRAAMPVQQQVSEHHEHQGETRLTIGMVGYPNVGKSSVINVLLGATALDHGAARVATGATPGKTKHFQTLQLPLREAASTTALPLTLCDCPGLVFPQFVSSAAEMLCAGVLPVAQLRDYRPPMRLLASRIPQKVLELTYGFVCTPHSGTDETAEDLLVTEEANQAASLVSAGAPCKFATVESILVNLGRARSWFAAGNRGEVDRNRVARFLLKDLQVGKLVHAEPPPTTPIGTVGFADYVAMTHRARVADLRERKHMTEEPEEQPEEQLDVKAAAAEADDPVDPLADDLELQSMEEEDAWMDMALDQELHGSERNVHSSRQLGATDQDATRARKKKNKKMLMKATRIKGKKKHTFVTDGGENGTVHASGRRHMAPGPAQQSGSFQRPIQPNHPSYNGVGES